MCILFWQLTGRTGSPEAPATMFNPQLQQQQQLQTRPLQQHQQQPQGIRPQFTAPTQVPVPPGWNQLPSGALQPPPAQGSLGTMTTNQGWKKAPLPSPMQAQLQARPSLATVQTPSHPSRSAALRSDEAESSPHPVRAFLLFLAPLHFSSSAAAATAAQLVSVPRVSPTSSPQPMAQAALGISAQGNHIPL